MYLICTCELVYHTAAPRARAIEHFTSALGALELASELAGIDNQATTNPHRTSVQSTPKKSRLPSIKNQSLAVHLTKMRAALGRPHRLLR